MPERLTQDLKEGDQVKLKNDIGWKTLRRDPQPTARMFILTDTQGMYYLARNEMHEVRDA